MYEIQTEEELRKVPNLKNYATIVADEIHKFVLDGGDPTRSLADFLHGVWLGHPLHAVLTDATIGAWTLGSVLDLIGIGGNWRAGQQAADRLMELGVASAIPTALAGITDYSVTSPRAISTAGTHGLLNTLALGLFSLSVVNRRKCNRGAGLFFSAMGLGVILTSAWLGGDLVYRYRLMVNKALTPKEPTDWTNAIAESDLSDRQPKKVEVSGNPVLLYREGNEVYAIGEVCSHDGGPLEEGKFFDHCVECPWHQSVFDLRNGHVVHGPSTYGQPVYETRRQDGQIQIRITTP